MADNEEVLRLALLAEVEQVQTAAQTLRAYIQTTTEAVKAGSDLNAVQKDLASNSRITAEAMQNGVIATTKTLKGELNSIANAQAIYELGGSFGAMAREEGKAEQAAAQLAARLHEIGASQDEIQAAARAFAGAQGGSEGGGFDLSRIGSRLRGLPSTPIPGTGVTTDAVANIIRVLGALPPVILPVVAGLGAVAAAFVLMNKSLEDVKKAAEEAAKASQAYYDAIGKGETTEEAKKRIEELQRLIKAQTDAVANQVNAVSTAFKSAQETYGDAIARTMFAIGNVNSSTDEGKKKLDEYNAELQGLQRAVDANALASNDQAEAAAKAAQATEKLNDQLYKYAQDSLTAQVDTQEKIGQLIKGGSEKDLDDAIQSTKDQIQATKLKIAAEYELAKKYEDDPKRYAEISQTIDDLQHHQTDLQHAFEELGNATVRAYVQANDAAQRQAAIQHDSAAAYEKYENDITKIEDKYQQARLTTEDKYQDKLTSIAEQAAKAAANALEKLSEKRQDLAAKFAQTEADAQEKAQADSLDRQIKFQRQQAHDAEEHARNLRQIIKDSQDKEHDLILNRDFAGLFQLKRETSRRLDEENDKYRQQQNDRLQAFADENADYARHYIEQERQRQETYARELQQAQIQYQREREQAVRARNDALSKAAEAYRNELSLLSQKHQQELQARQSAVVSELQMIQTGNAQKLQLEQQYYAASQQLLQRALASVSSGGLNYPNVSGFGGSSYATTNNNGTNIGAFNVNQSIQGGADVNAIASTVQQQILNVLQHFLA